MEIMNNHIFSIGVFFFTWLYKWFIIFSFICSTLQPNFSSREILSDLLFAQIALKVIHEVIIILNLAHIIYFLFKFRIYILPLPRLPLRGRSSYL